MKLKRGINIKELEELIKYQRVVPKRNMIVFNNPGEIQLTLNILRSKLDWEDVIYAPNGYTIHDIKYCEYNGQKGTVEQIWQRNFQK